MLADEKPAETPAEAPKEGEAKAGGEKMGKPAAFEKKKTQKLQLLNSKDKLVLPMYCKSKLESKEVFGIATHTEEYLNAWREAAGAPDAEGESLPMLEPAAFAKFYANVTADMFMDVGMLGSAEAESKKDDLAATINFQNANLKKVSWYQFWIFLCAGEVMPAKHEYMRNEPADPEAFMKKLGKKMNGKSAKVSKKKFYRMRGRSRASHRKNFKNLI